MYRTYSELSKLKTFKEKFDYLKLDGRIPWVNREMNQMIYRSKKWRDVRRQVVIRDSGFDLGSDIPITGFIHVHHINPITLEDIQTNNPKIFDPENLISCSYDTHNAIHYGEDYKPQTEFVERKPNDTCPWKE